MNIDNPTTDFTLENLYGDSITRLDFLFKTFNEIYKLPEFIHNDKIVIPDAFEYAKKRRYFVILVLHTKKGFVYFQRSFDTGHLSMNLPGSSIKINKQDTIVTAIERLAKKSIKNARIADIAPIISLKNKFYCTDGRIMEHIGLGIRALLLNDEKEIEEHSRDYLYKGSFLKQFPFDEIPHPPAQKTFEIFQEWYKRKEYSTYTNEIETQHAIINRYNFHQKIINPILKGLSHLFGEYSIREYKKEVLVKIGKVDNIIDVACGDDQSIFNLLSTVNLVVANDISVDQINNMRSRYNSSNLKYPKSHAFVLTNHDCLDLPFRSKVFDMAICRNLLHHMNSASDLKALFSNMKRVAKKILIIEVQDPMQEKFLGRIRHKYYLNFLMDEGENFYTKIDFEKVIMSFFKKDEVVLDYYPTIRGVYMMAQISCYEKQNS